MHNASKPGPSHHLDIIALGDAHSNHPLFMHPFQKTGVNVADLVLALLEIGLERPGEGPDH